ncbi:MAG: NAD(P)/FAD-dependent oxidoreductase [Bacilli bacterium]
MYDTIIIGGGPSGMSAALNLLRASKKVLILEKESFGGQIASSPRVENFPTIQSISGLDLTNRLLEQIMNLGVEFDVDEVIEIKKENDIFKLKTTYTEYEAKSVIIATGLVHRKLNLESEARLEGKGVSYCAVCDGAFYKGEDAVVIGDANTALQYAILLSNYCNKVYLYTLFDKFFADPILVERMEKIDNIFVKHNLNTVEFIGQNELEQVHFVDTKTKEDVYLKVKAAFVAIGQIPNNKIFSSLVDLDERGFILVNNKQETKTDGLYAIGDCTKKDYYQLITGMSEAAVAALNVTKYLS